MVLPSDACGAGRGCVVLCHGIPGGRRDPLDPGYSRLAEDLARAGFYAVYFNFRGAGESSGDFDIRGWVDDLTAVIAFVTDQIPFPPILFGFSAGGAVSAYLAAQHSGIGGLILCGCPADFNGILVHRGADQFLEHARAIGIIRTPGFPFDRAAWVDGFNAICAEEAIGHITGIPKLIIHGDNDDVVPVSHAYRLYDRAQEPKELVIIPDGGHRLRLNKEAMDAAEHWLDRLTNQNL